MVSFCPVLLRYGNCKQRCPIQILLLCFAYEWEKMASRTVIIDQIEKTVQGKYQEWQIGVTDDSASRKAQLGNPISWLQWLAESEDDAAQIVNHFADKGMHQVGYVEERGDFVYILLIDNPVLKLGTPEE